MTLKEDDTATFNYTILEII